MKILGLIWPKEQNSDILVKEARLEQKKLEQKSLF